jgi:hypothetical protein
MAKLKGTNIVTVRDLMKPLGEEGNRQLQTKLSAEDYKLYINTVPVSWVPIEQADRIFNAVAGILFPEEKKRCEALGRASARAQMSGIYRFLIMIPTTRFIIKQQAAIFKISHDEGESTVAEQGDKNCVFSVSGYPSLTAGIREIITGYIDSLMSLAGTRHQKVLPDFSNPQNWRWHITWE